MSEHKAQDSNRRRSRKDKSSLKNIESPELDKMYSVKLYIKNAMGIKFSHTAYNSDPVKLVNNISSYYTYDEIKEPKNKQL